MIPVVLTVNTTEPELDTAVMSVNVSSPPSSSQVSKEGFLDMFLKIPLEEVFDLHSDQWKASGKNSHLFLSLLFCLFIILVLEHHLSLPIKLYAKHKLTVRARDVRAVT